MLLVMIVEKNIAITILNKNKMRKHCDGYIGTFSIEEMPVLERYYRRLGLKVRFRGRHHDRKHVDNHEKDYKDTWKTDFPLQFAERVAVYEA